MSQENLNFVEVPSNGKHNKILYDGHYLTYDRTNKKTGRKYYRCLSSYCKVINVIFKNKFWSLNI